MLLLITFISLFISNVHTSAQKLTGFGEWRLYYFLDEFGDSMYDKPFLETKINNPNGKTLTIALTNKVDSSKDVMSFGIDDGYCLTALDRNASISFKLSNGKIYKFNIPDTNLIGGQIYIRNQKDIATIANILNRGNCKVSISAHWEGDSYVSPNHIWSFSITNQTKDILNAYDNYLQ